MTETTHQDPAEPNKIDTEVETDTQPEPKVEPVTTDGEITHGGEGVFSTTEPAIEVDPNN